MNTTTHPFTTRPPQPAADAMTRTHRRHNANAAARGALWAAALAAAAMMLWPAAATAQTPAAPEVSLAVSPNPAAEGSPVAITVTLSEALSVDVAVPVTFTRVTSEASDHATLSSIPVTAGQTTGMGSVSTAVDGDSDDETFTVAIDTAGLPSSLTAGSPTAQTVTITDTRAAPAVQAAYPDAPTQLEARAGDGQVTLVWDELIGATGYEYQQGTGAWTDAGEGTAHTVTGLRNGSEHSFRVRGVSVRGHGAATAAVTVVPLAAAVTAPDAPASVSVTHNGWTLSVSWPAAARADRYDVQHRHSGAGSWTSAATDHAGTSLTVHSVDAGRSYAVRVRAANAGGPSAWTASADVSPEAPAAPASVSVSRTGRTLSLNWGAAALAAGYDVQYQAEGAGSWTTAATGRTERSLTIAGVDPAATYTARVRAVNAGGASAWTNSPPAPPPLLVDPPDAPASVRVTHRGARLQVRWDPAPARADRYDVQYRAAGAAAWTTAASELAATRLTFDTPDDSKSYTVRVRTKNDGGDSGWTTSASAPSPAPYEVGSLSVTHTGTSLSVSWLAPARADRYDVEYRESGTASWTSAATDHTTTTLTISGVDSTKSYTVQVKAKNDTFAGGWETSASASPPQAGQQAAPDAPASVSVVHNGISLSVSWPAADGAATYEVVHSRDGRTWQSDGAAHQGTSLTIHGVRASNTYTVRVRASNDGGASSWTASAATAVAAPDPVASMTVYHYGNMVMVTFGFSSRALTYDIDYSTDGGSTWQQAAADYRLPILQITDADPALTYTVRIKAKNPSGDSAWTTSTPTAPTAPAAPDPVTASSINITHNGTSLTVTWTAPARADAYDVTYQGNGSDSRAAWDRAGTTLTITCDIRPRHHICVNAETAYTVAIRAKNAGGESTWVTSASAPAPQQAPPADLPPAPANVTVTESNGRPYLNWDGAAGATGYEYRLKEQGTSQWGRWWSVYSSGILLRANAQRPLDPGKNYLVQVRTVKDSNGTTHHSNPSTETEFTMPG